MRPAVGDAHEVVDGGLHGHRIGVVGVVEQQAAAGQLGDGAAQVAEGDLRGAVPRLVEAVAELQEGGKRGQRVVQVVAAGEAEVERAAVAEGVDEHVRAVAAALLVHDVHVGLAARRR